MKCSQKQNKTTQKIESREYVSIDDIPQVVLCANIVFEHDIRNGLAISPTLITLF